MIRPAGLMQRVGLAGVLALVLPHLGSTFLHHDHQPDLAHTLFAQGRDAEAARVDARIRALQQEGERLATEARTLLGDLRKLEIDRDLATARLAQAQDEVAEAQSQVEAATARLAALEEQRIAQLPDIKTQLVDVYKRGRAGYASLLFGARSMREFARATRAVAALALISEQRLADHQATLASLREERAALEQHARELRLAEGDARRARDAAQRAVATRTALIDQIDERRDLNAQLAGELQLAYERLRGLAPGGATGRVTIPLAAFQDALDWPATGAITGRFGQPVLRAGVSIARNGIDIAAAEGQPVAAVHPGTVSFAGPFSGFGNLVIVDHGGNNYSLYGYLSSIDVQEGATVETGSQLGRVGLAPAGPPTLYFELRIDGRSVDPLQWLSPR